MLAVVPLGVVPLGVVECINTMRQIVPESSFGCQALFTKKNLYLFLYLVLACNTSFGYSYDMAKTEPDTKGAITMDINTTHVNHEYTRGATERLLPPAVVTALLADMTTSTLTKRTGRTPHISRQAKAGDWGTMQLQDFLLLEAVAMAELHRKEAIAESLK